MSAAAHLHRLRETLDGPLTLGELSAKLGAEAPGLLVFLFSLPFLQPIPLAGLGTPVGLLLAAIGLRLARGGGALQLPDFVAKRRLEAHATARILSWSEAGLGFVERILRPRKRGVVPKRACGAAIILLGIIFSVPIFVPLGNPATAAPLACFGLALLEEDAVFAGLGFFGTAATFAYHAAFLHWVWIGAKTLAR
jgi:hypothetical protein